ncbi:MAG: site-2 protease family protein [Anaerolineae bacterium]
MLFGRSQEELIALLIALVPAFTIHEFAHAWTAYRLGDSTAKDLGRLTLNPMKHLDVFGILLVLVVGFGWAKPVPVNPYNLRHGRRDMAIVAVAGPLSNLAMAAAMAVVWRLANPGQLPQFAVYALFTFVWLNIVLLFFNLLPIAPLDGFKVAVGLLPEQLASRFARTAQWGMFVLIALMLMGTVTARLGLPILDILGTLVTGPTQAVVSRLLGLPL